ncbi:uncharacterized protein K452DRAFT_311955 [Aplosporella prunicola CBS 121167]|uniref:F-box domain-containing protein n=1 Tax=Aplosporella prunicola CBS 121167 TaxID=1176127 RepID=A0A6A6B4D8_9PEZI|nr:uncharacterized protein K452DRAFT_311955 [Aplosporella prunicola CBS 121167]KAF2137817.1 hypothetical protein K452DRAFT_311955 [Aplosporella prunicola CBS 121167]
MSFEDPPIRYSRRRMLDDLPPEIHSMIFEHVVGATHREGQSYMSIISNKSLRAICNIRLVCRSLSASILRHFAIAVTNKGIRFLPDQMRMLLSFAQSPVVAPAIKRLVINASIPRAYLMMALTTVAQDCTGSQAILYMALDKYQEYYLAHRRMKEAAEKAGGDIDLLSRVLKGLTKPRKP